MFNSGVINAVATANPFSDTIRTLPGFYEWHFPIHGQTASLLARGVEMGLGDGFLYNDSNINVSTNGNARSIAKVDGDVLINLSIDVDSRATAQSFNQFQDARGVYFGGGASSVICQ